MADNALTIRPARPVRSRDISDFFRHYTWCLNPILTLDELRVRLEEEADRFGNCTVEWQQEEMRINLYLLACAVDCTIDDYVSRRRWNIKPVSRFVRLPAGVFRFAERMLNLPGTVKSSLFNRDARRVKCEADRCVEEACRLLTSGGGPSSRSASALKSAIRRLRALRMPADLRAARMRLNEGYRCQDLTYHDVIALADRYLEKCPDRDAQHVVVGARTAGSYFAPLIKIYLETRGFSRVSWISIRPRYGAHGEEGRRLKRLLRNSPRVILTDDYSNTGKTLGMLGDVVRSCRVPSRDITILAPVHPARLPGKIAQDEETGVIALDLDELYLNGLMNPESVEGIIRDLDFPQGASVSSVLESPWTVETNGTLWKHYPDTFQARLKRVYEVVLKKEDGSDEKIRLLAKSVGHGWLGYHAIMAGKALEEYVPEVYGLREGLLFMRWVEGRPLTYDDLSNEVLSTKALYVAARSRELALPDDPRATPPYLGWGWLEILSILRRAYNPLFGYLKHRQLLERLKAALHYKPVLVDGRMRPDEWRVTKDGLVKLDFEHHAFGAPELDVVDPAYDLAIASFEHFLSEPDEEKLVSRYSSETGDVDTLRERVFLYKLLYATAESERTGHRIAVGKDMSQLRRLNDRLLWCWNFRIFAMNRFCSTLMKEIRHDKKDSGFFFMDIDGVFNSETFGFPHTTVSGLEAIALLMSEGYSIVPNTGRSCEHVSDYCLSFGFPSGIAEYGSVIVDPRSDSEIPLVDRETLRELSIVRDALENADGIFVDHGYRYSVRAYRQSQDGSGGLSRRECGELLDRLLLRRLKVISRRSDTYFVGRGADKGAAMSHYLSHVRYQGSAVAAVGDSDEDVPMLRNAVFAYSPANCSAGIRTLAKDAKCVTLSGKCQKGLLQAARLFVAKNGGAIEGSYLNRYDHDSLQSVMLRLLAIAELPLATRIFLAVRRSGS